MSVRQKAERDFGEPYPPRVRAFRDWLITILPKAPNDKASRASLEAMPTRRLILAFITWRLRLIPAKPRKVGLWTGGVTPAELKAAEPRLLPLLTKVATGKDLTPHLSDLVMKKGIVLPGANPADRGKDIDAVLTRNGLHHFHIGQVGPGNPKGRSKELIFAEVLDKEFRIVAISDHSAFEQGSAEQIRLFGICHAYMAKDVPPGQAFIANPVMTSGHSLVVTLFANQCEDMISQIEPQLDDLAFVDKLYNDPPILKDGKLISRPSKPSLAWHFEDLKFGIIDRRTELFFCIFPLFDR